MKIIANGINDLYRRALQATLIGDEASPRGLKTRENLGVQLRLEYPEYNILHSPIRNLNYRFSVAEFLWMLLGQNDTGITTFNSQLLQFSDDGETFFGAYGPKLAEQLPYVVDCLKNDAFSRQAVINIWRERPRATKDVPCTTTMQFLLRDDQLTMITNMRSNDVYLGLPYDLFNFTQIQNYLAGVLDVSRGPYIHNVGSLHVYEQHYAKCEAILYETGFRRLESVPIASTNLAGVRYVFNSMTAAGEQFRDHSPGYVVSYFDRFDEPWRTYFMVLASKWQPGIISSIADPYKSLLTK